MEGQVGIGIAFHTVTGAGGLCSVIGQCHRRLGGCLFEEAPIVLSVWVTPGHIGAVEVSD